MLTAAQQRAVDGFTKSLVVLGDDALIDAHHQALEDYRDARTEGGDIVDKAYAQSLGPKPRCGIASRIIKAAISTIPLSGIR